MEGTGDVVHGNEINNLLSSSSYVSDSEGSASLPVALAEAVQWPTVYSNYTKTYTQVNN